MEVTLYYKDATSDKVYHAEIAPQGDLFVVNFSYGRRGSTLTAGTKTQSPVSFQAAQKIYDKLVNEKMAKGYTPGENGTPYTSENAGQVSGVLPQLLNEINEKELQALLTDYNWCAQQKYDGRRMMIRKTGDKVEAINRKGLIVAAPQVIIDQVSGIEGDFILDGEAIGDILYVFDIPSDDPLTTRLDNLSFLAARNLPNVRAVYTAYTTDQKIDLYNKLIADKAEGIVFKRMNSFYKTGRPNTGGDMLKFKFYATLTAVVRQINDKRSVGLELWDRDLREYKFIGNVTIPANKGIPQTGDKVEVRYLYATDAGILYQPIYLGPRTDVDDCFTTQLKYKGKEEDEE